MPTSTKYQGNPFISRRERQKSVVMYNRTPEEVNKQAVFISKTLYMVKVEPIPYAVQIQTGGQQKQVQVKLFVELRDGNAGYQSAGTWTGIDATKWTIQPAIDYFVCDGKKYVVNSVKEIYNINGTIDILEVDAQ